MKKASITEIDSFTEDDYKTIEEIKSEINANIKVGCTGCGYCMPCPMGVDIPATFRCYNEMYTENKKSGRKEYFQLTAFKKDINDASRCIGCGKCEKHCPQHIKIREKLKEARGELQTPWIKLQLKALRILKPWQ